MRVTIRQSIVDQLLVWAREAAPQECCGLLFGRAGCIERAQCAANVSDTPTQSFEIDPAALFEAQRLARADGPRLIGYFHSHPGGDTAPSRADAAGAGDENRLWLIVADDRLAAYLAVEGGVIEGRFRPVALTVTMGHIAE